MQLKTLRGYDFYEVSSALQKAIRRGDTEIAGYFAIELFESNYIKYVWKRLLTISAEDCWGVITREIEALHQGYLVVNDGKYKEKGRIFVAKAVIILSLAKKSRDADHLTNLVYDAKLVDENKLKWYLENIEKGERIEIPEYAFDCHTIKGKRNGKTKEEFFKVEFDALFPRQVGVFDGMLQNEKR